MIRTSGRGGWVGGGVMVGGLELYKLGIFIYIYLYFRNSFVVPKQRRGVCSL